MSIRNRCRNNNTVFGWLANDNNFILFIIVIQGSLQLRVRVTKDVTDHSNGYLNTAFVP
jgi:hypothetical protein